MIASVIITVRPLGEQSNRICRLCGIHSRQRSPRLWFPFVRRLTLSRNLPPHYSANGDEAALAVAVVDGTSGCAMLVVSAGPIQPSAATQPHCESKPIFSP